LQSVTVRDQENDMTDTSRDRLRIEEGPKRIRTYLGGELIADTTRVKLVWEVPYYPTYYFPTADVRMELVETNGETKRSPSRGDAVLYDVKGGRGRAAASGAYGYPDSPIEELRGLVAFRWDTMDHWFEEDEEVHFHARDPYTRIDILPSSRHVRIEVDGVTVADTTGARFLFETGLPTRYYIPKTDVRMDLLTPTDTTTHCPYKGTARYWSVTVGDTTHDDLVWSYPTPLPESTRIAGLVCFYDEKVDVYLDGELRERPTTKFA
jgi:uncharacterized protein (DUF427 family)